MKKTTSFLLLASVVLNGCAASSKNIQSQYVSPLVYKDYDCDQVSQEMMRIHRRVSEVSGKQDSQATKDAVALGVGLVIFWPALFFMIGDDQKDELARLKGEYDALEQTAIAKKCSYTDQIELDRAERERKATEEAEAMKAKKKGLND